MRDNDTKNLEVVYQQIKGGKADKLSIEDIAKKHGVSIDQIKTQIKMGIDVEREHTNDPKMAEEIALDHLAEFPNYYTKLKDMEKSLKKEKKDNMRDNDTKLLEEAYEELKQGPGGLELSTDLNKLVPSLYSELSQPRSGIVKFIDEFDVPIIVRKANIHGQDVKMSKMHIKKFNPIKDLNGFYIGVGIKYFNNYTSKTGEITWSRKTKNDDWTLFVDGKPLGYDKKDNRKDILNVMGVNELDSYGKSIYYLYV